MPAERIEEIRRIARSNEFWTLGSGDHLNMIDDLLEEVDRLREENRKLRDQEKLKAVDESTAFGIDCRDGRCEL